VATVRRADQIRRLLSGLDAGGAVVAAFTKLSARPVVLELALSDGKAATFTLYCWNVTLGGRGRAGERRVQMTSVPRPQLYPAGTTAPLLLGYHAEFDVFAAWDASKHRETRDPSAAGGSNSLYVPLSTLEEARLQGMASHDHSLAGDEHEVVVSFRPEAADHYLRLAPLLRPTARQDVSATAVAAGGGPVKRAGLSQRRVKTLRQVRAVARDARFPGEVLTAYGGRCAFCDLGAKLVDAAHIKSVRLEGPDHVTNGLGACPTHHRAFDRGFLLIEDDYSITVNSKKTDLLDASDVKMLARTLRGKLALPRDRARRPDVRFIRFHRRQFT
jgi:putative restriction endonuclease